MDTTCRECRAALYQARNHVQMAWRCKDHGVVTYDPQQEIERMRAALLRLRDEAALAHELNADWVWNAANDGLASGGAKEDGK